MCSSAHPEALPAVQAHTWRLTSFVAALQLRTHGSHKTEPSHPHMEQKPPAADPADLIMKNYIRSFIGKLKSSSAGAPILSPYDLLKIKQLPLTISPLRLFL